MTWGEFKEFVNRKVSDDVEIFYIDIHGVGPEELHIAFEDGSSNGIHPSWKGAVTIT